MFVILNNKFFVILKLFFREFEVRGFFEKSIWWKRWEWFEVKLEKMNVLSKYYIGFCYVKFIIWILSKFKMYVIFFGIIYLFIYGNIG